MTKLHVYDFRDNPFKHQLADRAANDYSGYFHYHQGIEFLYVHQGQGTVTLEQQLYRIEPGTLFIFQPYQLHHVRALVTDESPYIRSVMQFDPHALQTYIKPMKQLDQYFQYLWKSRLQTQVFTQLPVRHPIDAVLRSVQQLSEENPDHRTELQASLLIQIMWYLQAESLRLSIPIDTSASRVMTHIESILNWVEHYYAEPFELERIANELHLSKYHVSHLFKEQTGRSVTEYIMARRIKQACQMLMNTSLSVAEIGSYVGWPIASHFSQQFKQWVGCTPLQFRKNALRPNLAASCDGRAD